VDSLFIDTGGIDILVDPKEPKLLRFWTRFPKGTVHITSHVVCWEFFRQFSPKSNSVVRQRFKKLIDKDKIELVTFDKRQREIASKIYLGVKKKLEAKESKKQLLKEMHVDILIASEAVIAARTVLTQDIGDWSLIASVIDEEKIGNLIVIDKKDIQNQT
jgi:predicted nucleic acid-binding protein